MDEKTAALRDIFIDVADDDTVTERQEESPGTLTGDESREQRIRAVVREMRDRYGFETEFDDESMVEIAKGHFDDADDADIASAIGADEDAVFRARLDLHLLDDADRDVAVDIDAVRDAMNEGTSPEELEAELDADRDDLDRARRIVETEREIRRSNYRFRDEFRALLGDGDISERLTEAAKEDGLADATEGIETNTSF